METLGDLEQVRLYAKTVEKTLKVILGESVVDIREQQFGGYYRIIRHELNFHFSTTPKSAFLGVFKFVTYCTIQYISSNEL